MVDVGPGKYTISPAQCMPNGVIRAVIEQAAIYFRVNRTRSSAGSAGVP